MAGYSAFGTSGGIQRFLCLATEFNTVGIGGWAGGTGRRGPVFVKLLVIADINDVRWRGGTGEADILISCGDVTDAIILEAAWAFGCSKIFAVKGNHDSAKCFPEPIMDLHLDVVDHGGVRFGGLQGCWRYKPKGHFLYDQKDVEQMLDGFPAVDVFVSHNSPKGVHDREDEVHVGFEALGDYVARAKPRLLIHGHQHVDRETKLIETTVIGVSGSKTVTIH